MSEEVQDLIEGELDEFSTIEAGAERAIETRTDTSRSMAGAPGQLESDTRAEEGSDRSAGEADPQAPGESRTDGHAAAERGNAAELDPDADIPLDEPGETLTPEQRNDPD